MSKNVMIKPCPKCGSVGCLIPDDGASKILCLKCGIRSARYIKASNAIADWNDRPIEKEQTARIAKMEDALREIVRLSTPDCVCNNCKHCEEIAGDDYCQLRHTGSPLEDASSQGCDKFEVGGFIVPGTYEIAKKALEASK